jgi:hypothetical protein
MLGSLEYARIERDEWQWWWDLALLRFSTPCQ